MKIPPQAKRVFTGKIFNVYQWQQEMFDGTTETFEMLKRPDTTQIIPIVDGKIVVTKEEQPYKGSFVSLAGGRREEGEDPLSAAKRELLEETGFVSEDWELYKVYEPVTKLDWSIYTYIARDCVKKSEPNLDAGEKIDLEHIDFDAFVDWLSSGQIRTPELSCDILRMRLKPGELENFKKKLLDH